MSSCSDSEGDDVGWTDPKAPFKRHLHHIMDKASVHLLVARGDMPSLSALWKLAFGVSHHAAVWEKVAALSAMPSGRELDKGVLELVEICKKVWLDLADPKDRVVLETQFSNNMIFPPPPDTTAEAPKRPLRPAERLIDGEIAAMAGAGSSAEFKSSTLWLRIRSALAGAVTNMESQFDVLRFVCQARTYMPPQFLISTATFQHLQGQRSTGVLTFWPFAEGATEFGGVTVVHLVPPKDLDVMLEAATGEEDTKLLAPLCDAAKDHGTLSALMHTVGNWLEPVVATRLVLAFVDADCSPARDVAKLRAALALLPVEDEGKPVRSSKVEPHAAGSPCVLQFTVPNHVFYAVARRVPELRRLEMTLCDGGDVGTLCGAEADSEHSRPSLSTTCDELAPVLRTLRGLQSTPRADWNALLAGVGFKPHPDHRVPVATAHNCTVANLLIAVKHCLGWSPRALDEFRVAMCRHYLGVLATTDAESSLVNAMREHDSGSTAMDGVVASLCVEPPPVFGLPK